MKLTFIVSTPHGVVTAPAEEYRDIAAHAFPFPVIGIRTCIDESSVYHADLSSPFLEDAPHPHSLSV